jgi:hypothetical protein
MESEAAAARGTSPAITSSTIPDYRWMYGKKKPVSLTG